VLPEGGVLNHGIAVGEAVDPAAKAAICGSSVLIESRVPRGVAQEERAAHDQVVVGRIRHAAAGYGAVQLHGCV
jgi:hypothetical protein